MIHFNKYILLVPAFIICRSAVSQSAENVKAIADDYYQNEKNEIDYIKLKSETPVYEINAEALLNSKVLSNGTTVKKLTTEKDILGYSHIRYQLIYNNIPVHNTQIIAHSQNGKLVSVNGDLKPVSKPLNHIQLSEAQALKLALKKVNASVYKWENKTEEQLLQKSFNEPGFSFYPKAKTIVYSKQTDGVVSNHYAYLFPIYADIPLYGANVIIDAESGRVLAEEPLIHEQDVPGTATTKFSGVVSFTMDNTSPGNYRLQETGRGLGIETYDMNTSQTFSTATDYTNTSSAWTNTATVDQVGTDAHWGAENVYDYYFTEHGRNSIDNAGHKLISYADYGVGYANAFWNGFFMTYGSGSGGGFTGLDICGHEVTHGLTSKTAQLVYQNESGALNESYSDIFGVCIEKFGKPTAFNWTVGENVGGIRSMSNPNSFGQPDTYLGTSWYTGTADNGGVHTNSGVSNYWFYLLCQGGSGMNDKGISYTVTPIGMTSAAKIAFRALTVYYIQSTNYASARNLSIQAAIDLFGPCSNEVFQTKSAWYAVGVGPSPSGTNTPVANFNSFGGSPCSLPFTTNFVNTTYGGDTYSWDFGDGSAVSTATNPIHTYTNNGTYSVKLKATSACATSPDSIIKNGIIVINGLAAPNVTTAPAVCDSGSFVLSSAGSDQQYWYLNSSVSGSPLNVGNTFTTPVVYSNTTFYVVNTSTNPSIYGGPLSNTVGTGGNFPGFTAYDSLDVLQPCTIKSVVVYAATTAARVFELRNSANAVIQSTTVNLTTGTNTVNLNFNLNAGSGYRIGLGPGAAGLYRNTSGITYPYAIGSLVKITGSSFGPSQFFFFYNWEVAPANCTSPPVAVTTTINPSPVISVTSSQSIACTTDGLITLNATPVGGTYSGTGVTANSFNPGSGAGTYTVNYNYTDGNGCSGTGNTNIVVSPCIGIEEYELQNSITIYPNPFSDHVFLKGLISTENYMIKIINALGKLVCEKTAIAGSEMVDLEKLAQGIYTIEITNVSGILSRSKLVKQ